MKILLVSDKEETYIWDFFDHARFKDVDLILSCGDLKAEYLSFLVTMIHSPLYYVHGNHNKDYLTNPPEGCISAEDSLITVKGIRIAGLGGSMLYNRNEFQYSEEQMAKRIRKLNTKLQKSSGFDILLTHAPAYQLGDGRDLCHTGFKCFVELVDKYSPKYMIHGHQHMNYSNQQRKIQYKSTTILNAYGYYLLEY
jgi:Icc-related predicted phosphoesterase